MSAMNHHLDVIKQHRPTLMFLQLGTNDIGEREKPVEYFVQLLEDFTRILKHLGVKFIYVGEVIKRGEHKDNRKTPPFSQRVAAFNKALKAAFNGTAIPNVMVWEHRNLRSPDPAYLDKDGVHLNNAGSIRYYRSLRGAMLNGLKRMGRTLHHD